MRIGNSKSPRGHRRGLLHWPRVGGRRRQAALGPQTVLICWLRIVTVNRSRNSLH